MAKYKPGDKFFHPQTGSFGTIIKHTGTRGKHEDYRVITKTRKNKGPYSEANFTF